MVDKKLALELIKKYRDAWVNQDPNAILKIFTKDAIYHERVLEKPFKGHREIKKYWKNKVVGEQKNIKFKLLSIYIEKDTIIAEWEVNFYDKKREVNIHMKEVAILEIRKDKIKSLREYWSSEKY